MFTNVYPCLPHACSQILAHIHPSLPYIHPCLHHVHPCSRYAHPCNLHIYLHCNHATWILYIYLFTQVHIKYLLFLDPISCHISLCNSKSCTPWCNKKKPTIHPALDFFIAWRRVVSERIQCHCRNTQHLLTKFDTLKAASTLWKSGSIRSLENLNVTNTVFHSSWSRSRWTSQWV